MARKLIVEVVGDSRSLERTFARSTTASRKFGRDMDTSLGRAEARFTKFQRVAAGGFIGGAIAATGITALKRIIDVSAESQQVLGQTRVALQATGKSWDAYGKQIAQTVKQQSRLGFDDEALLRTFSLFQRTTGDVNRALNLNNLAMDVARARFIDLEQAAQLVNKAALGQAGALRRLGIDAKAGSSGLELLALLNEKYGGSAKAASNDARTAMDRVAVSVENLQESLGTVLLPAVELLADDLAVAADTASSLVDGLRAIGNVKIPRIEIPFNITIGGQTVGDIARGGAGFLKFTPLNPLFGLTIAKAIGDQFRDQTGPGSAAQTQLANDFARSINTLTQNALDTAKGQTQKVKLTPAIEFDRLPGVDTGGPIAASFGASVDKFIKVAQAQAAEAIRKGRAAISKAAKDAAAEKQRSAFDSIIAAIGLQVDQAAVTRGIADDLRANTRLQAAIRKQIGVEGRTTELASQLFQARQARAALMGQQAQAAAAANASAAERIQAAQFRALGLDATGSKPAPTIANLKKQLAQLGARDDLTGAQKGMLSRIRKVLIDPIHKATPETRDAIKGLFATIRSTFDQETSAQGPLTTTQALRPNKILEGLGLGRDAEKELRARLSQFNSAGLARGGNVASGFTAPRQPITVHSTVTLDGKVVGQNTKKFLLNDRRNNPPQKRGPNS